MRIETTNKSWLRQYIPQPSQQRLYAFEKNVQAYLAPLKTPSLKQINNARNRAYCNLTGCVL